MAPSANLPLDHNYDISATGVSICWCPVNYHTVYQLHHEMIVISHTRFVGTKLSSSAAASVLLNLSTTENTAGIARVSKGPFIKLCVLGKLTFSMIPTHFVVMDSTFLESPSKPIKN